MKDHRGVSSLSVWKNVVDLGTHDTLVPHTVAVPGPGPLHSACGHCETASATSSFHLVTFKPIRQDS